MLRIGASGLLRIWGKIYRCVVNIVEGTVGWSGKSVCASRKKTIRAHYCQQDFWHSWGGQSFGCAGLNLHRTRSHLIFGVGVNYTLVTLKSEIITSSSSCSTVYRRFSNMTCMTSRTTNQVLCMATSFKTVRQVYAERFSVKLTFCIHYELYH